MHKPILSICIPTYNRCRFLSRILDNLTLQIESCSFPVEIYITDNASSDETEVLCQEYIRKYNFIRYFRQESNVGADKNFITAFDNAKGEFFWLFGDDDLLRLEALSRILEIIMDNPTLDMLALSAFSLNSKNGSLSKKKIINKLDYITYQDNEQFSKEVGIMFTFISGIIVNKSKLISQDRFILESLVGSNLVQLGWVFHALKHGRSFAKIITPCIFAESDNSGGYRFYEVFSLNFRKTVNVFFETSSLANSLIMSSLRFIVINRAINGGIKKHFISEDSISVVDNAYSDIMLYRFFYRWLFLFPQFIRLIKKGKNSLGLFINIFYKD